MYRLEDGKMGLDNDGTEGQRNQGTTPRKSVAQGSILIKNRRPELPKSIQNGSQECQMAPQGPKMEPSERQEKVSRPLGALRESPGAKQFSKRVIFGCIFVVIVGDVLRGSMFYKKNMISQISCSRLHKTITFEG